MFIKKVNINKNIESSKYSMLNNIKNFCEKNNDKNM